MRKAALPYQAAITAEQARSAIERADEQAVGGKREARGCGVAELRDAVRGAIGFDTPDVRRTCEDIDVAIHINRRRGENGFTDRCAPLDTEIRTPQGLQDTRVERDDQALAVERNGRGHTAREPDARRLSPCGAIDAD